MTEEGFAAEPTQRRRPSLWVEVLGMFFVATALVAGAYQAQGVLPFLRSYLSVLAAAVFLYLPFAWLYRYGEDLEAYGFSLRGARRSFLWYAGISLAVFPLFAVGYYVYVQRICPLLPPWLAVCVPGKVVLRLPEDLLWTVVGQVLVIAMPEELFFRGFLQGRLQTRFSPYVAVLLSSLLFALGHLLVGFQVGTLMVFFPGLLFGILRVRTGTILAGTLFHASCNVLIEVLSRSFNQP